MQIWAIFIFLSSNKQRILSWHNIICSSIFEQNSGGKLRRRCRFHLLRGDLLLIFTQRQRRRAVSSSRLFLKFRSHSPPGGACRGNSSRWEESYGRINQKVHSHLIKRKINWLNPIEPLEGAVGLRHSKAAPASSINHEQMNGLFSHSGLIGADKL